MMNSFLYSYWNFHPKNNYCIEFEDYDFRLKNKKQQILKYFRTIVIYNKWYYDPEKSYKCGDKIRIDHQKDSVS